MVMSYSISGGIPVGSYPDSVQGTPFVEAAEEKYKMRYALGVCTALKEADPKGFEETFGAGEVGLRNCALKAGAYADRNFDVWKVKWPTSLRAQIAAFA
jgi:hypothetical protein